MKSQNLTSSQFADKLGVQRSGMSHILSGRNKPSLDFVLKVLAGFPDLNPQWLLQGKGKMYANMAGPIEVKKAENPDPENKGQAFLFGAFPSEEVASGQTVPPAGTVMPPPAVYPPAEVQPVPFPSPDVETDKEIHSDPSVENGIEPDPDTEAPLRKIARIVLFYNDGTFSEFQPGNERP